MYLQTIIPEEAAEQISQLAHAPGTVAVILIGEHTDININDLIAALNQRDVTFVGAVLPGIIIGSNRYDAGIAVATFPLLAKPVVITGLNQAQFSIKPLDSLYSVVEHSTTQPTAMVLVDGLTTHIEPMLSRFFSKFRNRITYVGGGAGSLSLKQKPCVFDNHGLYQDAAVVTLLNMRSHLGVRHGWKGLHGPLIATKTSRNIVYKFGYETAFKKYSEIVRAASGQTLTKENFFEVAKGFPLGIYYKGSDRIVRDPIDFTDDGGLICVGEIPERAIVYILRGENKDLIQEANRATTEALGTEKTLDQCFVVDCISRVLFLQEAFGDELNSVRSALPPGTAEPIGMLTLGEIGSYSTGTVEFFNKTIVVCAMQQLGAPEALALADSQHSGHPSSGS